MTSSSVFKIQEHTIPTAHIREYPRALAGDQEEELKLAIKQYTPRESAAKDDQGVTVIGAHANGFPKVSITLNSRFKPIVLIFHHTGTLRASLGRALSTIKGEEDSYQ
jgi:hypothetical protein